MTLESPVAPSQSWSPGWILPVILLKAAMVIGVGPVWWPDSSDYTSFAKVILRDGLWLDTVEFYENYNGGFAFRMLGYPLFLAATKLVFEDSFGHAVIVFQSALSVALFVLILRLTPFCLKFRGASMLITVLYMLSPMTIFNVSILSDSISAVLVAGSMAVILGAIVGAWQFSPRLALGVGVAWALSVLIRDANLYFVFLPVVGVLLWAFVRHATVSRGTAMVVFVLAPVLLASEGYKSWNEHRTGDRFLSTTGSANWLRPVFDLKRHGLGDPFTGDDAVDRAVRRVKPPLSWPENLVVLPDLQRYEGVSASNLNKIVRDKYINTVLCMPVPYFMLVATQKYQIGKNAFISFGPIYQLDYLFLFSTEYDRRFIPSTRDLRQQMAEANNIERLVATVLIALRFGLHFLAVTLFLIFLVGGAIYSIRMVRRRTDDRAMAAAVVFCWFVFFAWSFIYGLVHREDRHLLPVLPFAWLGLLMILQSGLPMIRSWVRRRRHAAA